MDISGIWYNELNSTMELKLEGKLLRGSYVSGVGQANGPYDLVGFFDGEEFPTLGWTVVWKNDRKQVAAVTTWSGQAQIIDGGEQIDTTWLLTRSTLAQDDWESTMVGKDLFRRARPSDAEVRRALITRGYIKTDQSRS